MVWVHAASPEVDVQSRWHVILAVCVSLTVLTTITVAVRLYVRASMIRSVGIDDYVMLFSCICGIVYNGLCIGQSRYGLGLPLKIRPVVNLNKYSEINFAGRPFYMAGICGFKVALCCAYLRITGHKINNRYRFVIWTFLIFTIVSHLAGTLVLMFQCSPVKKSWRPRTAGTCLPNDITFYWLAGVSIFCDVCIILLPIPLLLKVQINARRKVALVAIFSLGLFTTVCSIMRMVQITTIAKTGDSTMLVLWGTIELNVGIFLTCLPSLTPLFTFFANKSRSYAYGQYSDRKINPNTANSMQLKQMHSVSHDSEATVVNSESQEHIVPIHKEELVIKKTTEIEIVREYERGVDLVPERRWYVVGDNKPQVN